MAEKPKKKNSIPLIGALALKNQLVTKAELEAALVHCKGARNQEESLKAYLRSQELISSKNLHRLALAAKAIAMRQKEFRFGAIALAKGFINKSVLDLALEDQEADIKSGRKPRLIGDMMVEAGLLTERQRDYILKLQNRVKKPGAAAPQSAQDIAHQDDGSNGASLSEGEDVSGEDSGAVGLLPPEPIVGGIQLQVSGDGMAAFLSKTGEFNEDITTDEIKDTLFGRGIVSGVVVDEMIDGFIQSTGFKTQSFRVAKGIRPIQGRDAKVAYFFNTDYLKAGGMDEDGNIDFKERGQVPLVEEGTVLAEKTPRVEARNGQNIYGDEVNTEEGADTPLKFGKGAVLSEDGLKLLASVRGYPKFSLAGVVFVHQEYVTGGDVDFETGHIEFDGNVNVKGCIKAGFKVTGTDVTTVELDGGIVEADGDLKVAGGINEGKIYARGNVYAKFILKSEIICMGDIHVQKEIVDSTIETSGACIIANGKLISSRLIAKMGVTARNIGTEMGAPSNIRVGHDAFTRREVKKNKARVAELKKEIAAKKEEKAEIKHQNIELQKKITELAHLQDRSQLEQNEINQKLKSSSDPSEAAELKARMARLTAHIENAEENLDACFEKSEALEQQIKAVDTELSELKEQRNLLVEERNNLTRWAKDNPGKAVVAVEGAMLAGNVIIGKHSDFTVDKMIRHVRVTEVLFKSEDQGGRSIYQMKVGNF